MLPQNIKTLANYIEEAGYETAYIRKWHLASECELVFFFIYEKSPTLPNVSQMLRRIHPFPLPSLRPPKPIQFKIIVPTHPFHIDRQRLFRYTTDEAILNGDPQYL